VNSAICYGGEFHLILEKYGGLASWQRPMTTLSARGSLRFLCIKQNIGPGFAHWPTWVVLAATFRLIFPIEAQPAKPSLETVL